MAENEETKAHEVPPQLDELLKRMEQDRARHARKAKIASAVNAVGHIGTFAMIIATGVLLYNAISKHDLFELAVAALFGAAVYTQVYFSPLEKALRELDASLMLILKEAVLYHQIQLKIADDQRRKTAMVDEAACRCGGGCRSTEQEG